MATVTVLANPRPHDQSVSQARLRRRQSTKRQDRLPAWQRPEHTLPSSLNDSTAGVASLLQRMSLESEPDHAGNQQQDAACTTTTEMLDNPESHDPQAPPPPEEVLCITVHRTDGLRASVNLCHPMVRVSVVDEEGGGYLKKSTPEQCVTSFYERGNPNVDYVMPVLTQPCSCRNKSQLQPRWEETLLFNEKAWYFTQSKHILLFFELLDFPSTPPSPRLVHSTASPWHAIAWAFLRLSEATVGSHCRLQLFHYPRRLQTAPGSVEVFQVWAGLHRRAYPSTLHVTVAAVPPQDPGKPAARSMAPTQPEEGSVSFEQLLLHQQPSRSVGSLEPLPSVASSMRARLPGRSCRVPSSPLSSLHLTSGGCSTLAFSHSGRFLAAGCADSEVYPLLILEVDSLSLRLAADGHRGIIYDISWAPEDQLLASASADGLVKLWSVEESSPVCVLPHPCYVYSVCFSSAELLFTGAFDRCIRVWSVTAERAQLTVELRGSLGLVNCLCWDPRACLLYSGDSNGCVGVWQEDKGSWQLQKSLTATQGSRAVAGMSRSLPHQGSSAVAGISLHCTGRKLLVHSASGQLAMVDLRIDRVSCEYQRLASSQRLRCASMLSPCGSLVFAGGASGSVMVWSTDTGEAAHSFTSLPLHFPTSALAYHPHQHLAAFSAFGPHQPILLMASDSTQTTPPAPPTSSSLQQRLQLAHRTLSLVAS